MDLPPEVWADMQEDAGEDTALLRAWLQLPIIASDQAMNSSTDQYGQGIRYAQRGDSNSWRGNGELREFYGHGWLWYTDWNSEPSGNSDAP